LAAVRDIQDQKKPAKNSGLFGTNERKLATEKGANNSSVTRGLRSASSFGAATGLARYYVLVFVVFGAADLLRH
jgi:hypothetical protein